MSPEGYGHMEGRGWASLPLFKVHFSQPAPLPAPEVLLEPEDKDLDKNSVRGRPFSCCFVCDQQPQLPRPLTWGMRRAGSLIQPKAMGCAWPHSLVKPQDGIVSLSCLLTLSPPQPSPMAPYSNQLHQNACPWLLRICTEREQRDTNVPPHPQT